MTLKTILTVLVLALAGFGAYVFFGRVVKVEIPKVKASHSDDTAAVTVEKPHGTVEE